jgi:stage V sporulation protein G
MRITEVHIKLVRNKGDKLKAFCSMTLDDEFVVRDIKVIEGEDGYFVAMPSRKMSDHCAKCGCKNHLKARFCNYCGAPLPEGRIKKNQQGRMRLHADIAHPINVQCRQSIQQEVVAAFKEELRKSTLPGYQPPEWDDSDDDIAEIIS